MQMLVIAGNTGKDAELRRTQNGDPVLNFTLAVDTGKDREGNKRPPQWYDVSIWGKRAEALDGKISKGTKLTLTGRPTARAHDGKAYLGINVDQLTFQGGGQSRGDAYEPEGGGQRQQSQGYNDDQDLDEVPF